MQVLILEASTGSAKAMVYDSGKGILRIEISQYTMDIGNSAVQNADGVYAQVLKAGRKAAKGYDISAIALSGAWHSLLVCDGAMNPVTPAYTWAYVNASQEVAALRNDSTFVKKVYGKTGCMVHAMYPVYKLPYITRNLSMTDKKITGQGNYNFFRVTGEFLSTYSMESGTGWLDIHTLDYSSEMLGFAGIKKEHLPQLCSHEETRPLLKEAAELLGVKAGIPVVPALSDGALNQVGSGAMKPGLMTLSVGTSAAIRMVSDRPLIPEEPSTWCYYSVGKHLCGAATSGAGNCVEWFVKNILDGRKQYTELEKRIKNIEEAPVFLPFLSGERCPGWRDDRKGGFYGLTAATDIGGQYYAILEGVLFNLYQCYQKLVSISRIPDKVFVSGGICNSKLWLSMLADIFQTDITLLENEQASLIGGAVLALHAAGAIQDIETFTLETKRIISPSSDKLKLYRDRFNRYLDYYSKMK